MAWPLSQDYNEAIQSPELSFSDPELRQGEARCNAIGIPMPRSGNFADVYEYTSAISGKKWAIKCFTRQVPSLRERYAAISAYLKQVNLPFMVDFDYLEQGIRVKGQWYPILKMHWVEGFTLNEFLREYADQPQYLEMLGQIWVKLARRLREAKMAHCDLQHGNVLLVPGKNAGALGVRLIDYDGMFVPALANTRSGEVGHPAFQHPQRLRDGTYNAEVDRFPNLVIYTALRGLIVGSRYLWNKFDNGDNLLFRQQDFENLPASPLFQELRNLKDPPLLLALDRMSRSLHKPLEQTPLLDELVPAATTATLPSAGRKSVVVVPRPAAVVKPPSIGKRGRSLAPWLLGAAAAAGIAVGAVFFLASRDAGGPKTEREVAQKNNSPTPKSGDGPRPTNTAPTSDRKVEPPPDPQPETKPDPQPEPKPEPKTEPKPEPKPELPPEPQHPPLLPGEIRRFQSDKSQITAAAFSPDGKRALSAQGLALVCWDLSSGKPLQTVTRRAVASEVAFLPDGRRAIVRESKNLSVIDLETGQELRRMETPTAVGCMALSADGRRAISGSGAPVQEGGKTVVKDGQTVYEDCFVRVWDVDTGQELRRFVGHTRGIYSVALSPDGRRAVSSSTDLACLWNVDTAQEIRRLPPMRQNYLAFCPDGRHVLFSTLTPNKDVTLWDVDANREVRRFPHPVHIDCITCSPDGRSFLTGSGTFTRKDGQNVWYECVMRLWDLASGRELRRFEGHTKRVVGVAFSPDGRRALSASDRTMHLWDLPSPGSTPTPTPAPTAPAIAKVLAQLNLSNAQGIDDFVRINSGGQIATKESYSGGLDITVVARTNKDNIHLGAYGRASVTLNWEQNPQQLRVGVPTISTKTGRPLTVVYGINFEPLATDTWYTLNWRVTEERMQVSVNGKVVGAITRTLDLSNKQPVVVSTNNSSVVDVKSMVVTPLQPLKPPDPPPVPKPAPVVKGPVPDAAAQEKALKVIQDLFKQDYAKATKAPERLALAGKLIQKGVETKDDPAARFVLFREARDLASQAGDLTLALSAIDHLAQTYAIDVADMKLTALTAASKMAITAPANKVVAEGCLLAVEDAVQADKYDAALSLLTLADTVAKKSGTTALATRVQTRTAEVREGQAEYGQVQAADETLRKDPANAAANLTKGKYYCLRKGEWDKGLPCLAAGSDPALQALAKKDLAKPTPGADQVALGDGWWDAGEASKGSARVQALLRASYWYGQAVAGLSGLTRDKVAARIKQASELVPATKTVDLGDSRRLAGHTARVNSVSLSADGKLALSGSDDKSMRLWDVPAGKELYAFKAFSAEVKSVALSADGKYAASGSGSSANLWEVESRRMAGSYPVAVAGDSGTPINGLAFLWDNQRFVMGRSQGYAQILSLTTGLRSSTLGSIKTRGADGAIHSVGACGDSHLVILGYADGLVQVYDADTRREVGRMAAHKDAVLGVAIARDARTILTCGADKLVLVWDTKTGKRLRTLKGHDGRVTGLVLSADGRKVVTGSDDRTVRLWDVRTGRELRRFTGHTDAVTSVAISADGRTAISGSVDQSIRIWDLTK